MVERRERNISAREKRVVASQLGTKSIAQARALTRKHTGKLLLRGTMPNQLSHPGQGSKCFLCLYLYIRISGNKN